MGVSRQMVLKGWEKVMNGKKVIGLGIWLVLGMAEMAIAHGVRIQHHITSAVKLQATYDSGEPMAESQVTIYAPNNPETPWKQGLTDPQGEFIFIPEPHQTGNWTVKIRQAGHGQVITIPIEKLIAATQPISVPVSPATPPSATSSVESYSPLQKGVMIGSVFWGCVGTALFFWRSQSKNAHS